MEQSERGRIFHSFVQLKLHFFVHSGSTHSNNEHGRFNVQTSNENGAIYDDIKKEERQCDENVSPDKSKATQQKDGKQAEGASSREGGNVQSDQTSLEQIEAEKYENFKRAVERQDDKVISQGKAEVIQGKDANHDKVMSGEQGKNIQNTQTSNKRGDTEKHGNAECGEEIGNDKRKSNGKTEGTQEKNAKPKKEVVINKGENIHKVIDEAVEKAVTAEDDRYKHHHLGIFSAILKGSKHNDDKDHG